MPEGNSLINLGDLSKPATILIKKISNAVGILYEPRRIKNTAKAEAEADKLNDYGLKVHRLHLEGLKVLPHYSRIILLVSAFDGSL